MAKDKSKKADKSADTKAAASDDFARPSEAPAAGEGWNLTEEGEGRLILFTPLREQDEPDAYSPTPGATKKVIVADLVVINEKKPEKSEPHDDVYIWGGYLKGSLRGFIGERRVLGRLVKGVSEKKGMNAPWLLEDATDAEVELAKAYLASVDPFAAEGGKKGKKSKG